MPLASETGAAGGPQIQGRRLDGNTGETHSASVLKRVRGQRSLNRILKACYKISLRVTR
jgi:hypothetical protein